MSEGYDPKDGEPYSVRGLQRHLKLEGILPITGIEVGVEIEGKTLPPEEIRRILND